MNAKTYRAAVWTSRDGQRQIVLTLPEHARMSNHDLLLEGWSAADSMGLGCNATSAQLVDPLQRPPSTTGSPRDLVFRLHGLEAGKISICDWTE